MLLWYTIASVYMSHEQTDVIHNEITAVEMSSNLINLEECLSNIK
jgi:virulence-associated protein VapD